MKQRRREKKKGERAGSKRGREEGWIRVRRVQKRLEKSWVKERQNAPFDFVYVILQFWPLVVYYLQ